MKMKLNVLKEYIRRLRKVLKSKLNGGNLVCGVNTWAVSLLRYPAAFVSWRKSELQGIDRCRQIIYTMKRRRKRFDINNNKSGKSKD